MEEGIGSIVWKSEGGNDSSLNLQLVKNRYGKLALDILSYFYDSSQKELLVQLLLLVFFCHLFYFMLLPLRNSV